MSAGSASPPTDRPGVDLLALERLIGVRSSKPSFYAAWRDKSARLDHTIETLERISSALCAAPAGPVAVCDAVVEAAAHHFDARWAAMVFSGEDAGVGMARVFVHVEQRGHPALGGAAADARRRSPTRRSPPRGRCSPRTARGSSSAASPA